MDTKYPEPTKDQVDIDILEEESIIGGILQKSYLIGRLLDQGSNGKVYKINDVRDPNKQLVMKITKDY